GNCNVRVGSAGAKEIGSAVNWNGADAAAQADAWARNRILAYVTAYLANGDAALVTYNDKSNEVPLRREWAGIVANSPALKAYARALHARLAAFPSAALRGPREEVLWHRQHFTSLRPIVGLTHVMTWTDPDHPDRIVIAQKQIYASHYFYGGLSVTLV